MVDMQVRFFDGPLRSTWRMAIGHRMHSTVPKVDFSV